MATKQASKALATTAITKAGAPAKTPSSQKITVKKPPVGDVTRTARAKSDLQRLEDQGGKRVVTDFHAAGNADLQKLLANNYGSSQTEVVIRAVQAAAASLEDSQGGQNSNQRKKKA